MATFYSYVKQAECKSVVSMKMSGIYPQIFLPKVYDLPKDGLPFMFFNVSQRFL